jgi:N-acetylmuramoyl-L-alanine amidase
MTLGLLPALAANASVATPTAPAAKTEAGAVPSPATTAADSPASSGAASPDTAAQRADAADASDTASSTPDARHVECVAKVIMHEAGNQSRKGKIAVAQVIRARLNDPRFPKTACEVISQPGQFFNVNAYRAPRETAQWREAVEIATDTLSGRSAEYFPGALFFHAAGARMPGRVRLGQIEGHVFYR